MEGDKVGDVLEKGEAEQYLLIDVVNNDPFRKIVIALSIS